jgi:hypothetical protein
LERSINCFLKQDYPRKQLFIYEEESDSFEVVQEASRAASIQYKWSPHRYHNIGQKRNAMCEVVTGDLIAHWDDDDWHSPSRLSTQVAALIAKGARLCGMNSLVFYDGVQARQYSVRRDPPWLAGGTLIYERSLWQEQPFIEVLPQNEGEDTAFVDAAFRRGVKIATIEDPSLYVAMLHDRNTAKRNVESYSGFDVAQVRKWME